DINPGVLSAPPSSLTDVNGTLMFRALGGLWKSDGTAAGTALVKGLWGDSLTIVNGTLFFSADDGKNGTELWKSNGTKSGTVLVKDIYSGSTRSCGPYGPPCQTIPNSSAPADLANVNGTLYFTATDGVNGRGLWKSNGTARGTVLVKNIAAG